MSIVKRIKELGKDKVTLTSKMRDVTLKIRPYLTEEYLKGALFDFDKLVIESKQNGTHALVYDISNKYYLVIIVAVNGEVRIVSAWKTSKSFERLLRRYGGFWYVKKG
ncbi:MAG: hypothetical protein HRF40_07455 [Nitrososphaera sp.]